MQMHLNVRSMVIIIIIIIIILTALSTENIFLH